MAETSWQELFKPENGMVFEIMAYGVTAQDYEILLPVLAKRYPVMYSENGESKDLPDYNTIVSRRNLMTTMLEINIVGVQVRCWFVEDNEIDLDLLPDDVDSQEKAEGVFDLMSTIAETLKKRVFLTGENAGAPEQWAEEHAVCIFEPPTHV